MCLFQMTVWWLALILLCYILNYVDSTPSHVPWNKYNSSFRLTKSTRTRVQQLLNRYKEQHLGNKNFEDRNRQLKDLPLLSTDFDSWLKLEDWERLHAAFWDMQAYWNMLEWKRKQLEREGKEQRVARTTLPQSIKHVQLDLRDLMSQVSSQMSYMKSSWVKPTSPTVRTALNPEPTSKTVWDSRVDGYIILRDLDLYLTKLARDFLLLASKTRL
ncbi:uncharacterized protein LOC108893571 isoform X2 [Lates calcarifer]|uniref:Uncharacterized protein LOC108893571 isoform X2 n=1 Tax=Lates calcarifer TaxID=8187 RepID=A0AAJ7VCX6_LATCA|nr:uncharacterized protein LOC108893571 isoform X2 [Lates calcarifer]